MPGEWMEIVWTCTSVGAITITIDGERIAVGTGAGWCNAGYLQFVTLSPVYVDDVCVNSTVSSTPD